MSTNDRSKTTRTGWRSPASRVLGADAKAIDAFAARARDDATRLVEPGKRSRVSKCHTSLPPEIELGLIASESTNVNETLAQWTRAPNQKEVA
jgi:hypothetical protein